MIDNPNYKITAGRRAVAKRCPRLAHWCAALAAASLTLYAVPGYAVGGCGTVCLPLELQDTHVNPHQLRLSVIGQYDKFDHYRVGTGSLANPGGAEATIAQVIATVDYGLTSRVTASLVVPYVRKGQSTRKFGKRVASGLGDLALFVRYALWVPKTVFEPTVSVGLGAQFPTGSTNQPTGAPLLPPALQVGSGAYALVPTVSYFQRLGPVELFGNAFVTIPLDANDRGYRFGRDFQLSTGAVLPLRWWGGRMALLGSFDYAFLQHDQDAGGLLPPKLREGTQVINTGGRFLAIAPGLQVYLGGGVTLQARFEVPIYQSWNGDRAKGIGQVAQDLTTLVSFVYTAGKTW